VAEGKDFCLQRCLSLKCLPNQKGQRGNDREHGIGNLQSAPFKFNLFNENGVFGSDSQADLRLTREGRGRRFSHRD